MILRQRLCMVMSPDAHAENGQYHIRSMYFDTPTDTALREKLAGVSQREKFRIRYYNGDASHINLEKKSKCIGLGNKKKARMSAEEVQRLLDGDIEWMRDSGDRSLLYELYQKMIMQGLQPKTIVDYTREPFVYAPGNVRVTLDYDLRLALHCRDFLDPDCLTIPAGDPPVILEVKWDEFLPDVIRDIVQLDGRKTSSFSKYAACRIYG